MSEPKTYKEWLALKIAKMHSDMLGKESVAYGPATGAEMCSGCRWFNEPWQGETHGFCQLVSGEILPSDVCDRHETIAQPAPVSGEGETASPPATASKKIDTVLTRKSKVHKMLPKEYRLNHAFEWMLPHDINADEFFLIKGVAATEGKFKSGDVFTASNLAFGAGGMSTAAMQGIGILDIDHFHEELPERYAKYGLEGEHGEIGFLIDAGISVNKVIDEDGKTRDLTQVEWVGYTTNKKVAELVDAGKFIGTSVEDWSRSADCETDDNGFPTGCAIEGSHFINLGLILDETPDSHGTWVNRVTQDDLDQWKRNAEKNAPQFIIMKADAHKLRDTKQGYHWARINRDARRTTLHELADYIDKNGNFKDGKDGLFEYLTSEVKIDEINAKAITDYLWDHPQERNSWQMEMMSAADWVAWYGHMQIKAKDMEIANLRGVLKKHGIKCLKCGNEAKRKTKREVIEKPAEGCPDGYTETEDGQCSKPDELYETINKPEGGCPEGFTEINDGMQCTDEPMENNYDTIDMPEGGCPEGYRPINDDTQCTNEPAEEAVPLIDMGRFLKQLKSMHNISPEVEKSLRGLLSPSLKKKERALRTALSVESPIDRFEKSTHLEEHLEPINVDKELVKVAQMMNFNRPGTYQTGQILLAYRLALKTIKQLKKKDN